MKQMMIAVVVAVALLPWGAPALAGSVTIDISQVGANVVMDGSGSVNLSGLTRLGLGASFVIVQADLGMAVVGDTTAPGDIYIWGVASGPKTFGTGGPFVASSGTGDFFGIDASGQAAPLIYLPSTYVSGSALSASDTFANTTIAALGLTPGTYTYTWGTGDSAGSLTVNIGSVPEPSSLTMAATALGLCGGLGFSRRRNRV
jgi:hypothetical protein